MVGASSLRGRTTPVSNRKWWAFEESAHPTETALDVRERILELDQLSRPNQLGDAAVEVDGGLEALGADLLVTDLVVPLVGVVADLGEVEVEVGVLEDLAGDVFL